MEITVLQFFSQFAVRSGTASSQEETASSLEEVGKKSAGAERGSRTAAGAERCSRTSTSQSRTVLWEPNGAHSWMSADAEPQIVSK